MGATHVPSTRSTWPITTGLVTFSDKIRRHLSLLGSRLHFGRSRGPAWLEFT